MADDVVRIAMVMPEYIVEREVGRGGMGVVYLGRQRRLDRPVAIKELPPARPPLMTLNVPPVTVVLPFDPTVPRVSTVSSSYPLGTQLALSTDRWDARAALVNSAPARNYAVGAPVRPDQTPVLELGGGGRGAASRNPGGEDRGGALRGQHRSRAPAPGGLPGRV
jgi:hypothetical protein